MTLLYTLFAKFVPIISIWELKVGEHAPHETAHERAASTRSGRRTHERRLRAVSDARRRAARGERPARRRRRRRPTSPSCRGEPIEDYEFAHRDKRHLAVVHRVRSAASSASRSATWLTRMTELAWPLPTGDMPIVAWWPNLIIMFEMTMLGAILATVRHAARHREAARPACRRSTIPK